MSHETESFDKRLLESLREIVREEVKRALVERPVVRECTYLTCDEAAELAAVSCQTIRRWIDAERLTDHGAGREIRIERNALAKLMSSKRRRVRSSAKRPGAKSTQESPELLAMRSIGLAS